ncbi:MAG: transketolase, partial [Acidimicrobiia bacterium]|nr:transketolase [Acidimicrobiia bacterium]
NFRQWSYPTAGHPERHVDLGIETTTGPLGQGFGNGVGMAIAEAHLRAVFGTELIDHRTYALVSDGDLMEGIASEAASLAGHLGLGRLIYYFDDNKISLDGPTDWTFTEDVGARFRAYGWHTLDVDGHDRTAIAEATEAAIAEEDRPSLLLCRTHIGYGAPTKQDTAAAHGSPLGEEEVRRTKEGMGWPVDEPFLIPPEVTAFFEEAMERNTQDQRRWTVAKDELFAANPEVRDRWHAYWRPSTVEVGDLGFEIGTSVATRNASGAAINAVAAKVPGLIGGSADLSGSTKTDIDDSPHFSVKDREGRNLYFGVREHAMGAIVNGMAVHGGTRPFGGTFLVFSDYMRASVRLSALMEVPSIWIWTHDSVFLGEDGPTHQPVEHLASLRAIPNLWVIRPADAGEAAEAWEVALNRAEGPTGLVFTRQGVPVLDRARGGVARGGYVLRDGDEVVLVATGSEVWVALEAADLLQDRGVSCRVVSLPCWEAFFAQDEGYRREVLGDDIPRVSLEAGATFGWERIVGATGLTIGIDHFGASAPWEVIAEHLGFTPEAVAARIDDWLGSR